MEFLNIFESLPNWVVAITSVLTAATAITALTPSQADDKMLNMVDALTLMAKETSDNQILIERSLAVLAQIANDLDEDVKNNAQAIIQMRGQIP